MVFFMLSGYWVSRLYSKKSGTSSLSYFSDRLLRIWPLLAVTAISIYVLVILTRAHGSGNLFSTLMLFGLATRKDDVIGVAWSLDIELQFYAGLPVVLYFISRFPEKFKKTGVVVGLAGATAVGTVLAHSGVTTVLAFLPMFAAGAFIWFGKPKISKKWALRSLYLFILIGIILYLIPETRTLIMNGQNKWFLTRGKVVWRYDLAYQCFCMVIVPFVAWNVGNTSSRLDRELGNFSYPLYLVHFPVIRMVQLLPMGIMEHKATAAFLSICTALAIYVIIDRPLERLRHKRSPGRTEGKLNTLLESR